MNPTGVHQEKTCIHTSNSSCLEESNTPTDVLLYVAVAAVVFVTMCGNLLVIISICHFKQLHTPTNLLLLSLAVADFLVGAAVIPFHFIALKDPLLCFGELYCTICNVVSFHLTCVSIYNVAFIAVDRYFALCNPFLYSTKMTVSLTLRIISILWFYSFIYNVMLLYFNGNITDMKGNGTCAECIATVNELWGIIDFIVVFIVPCTTIIITYLNIFSIARKQAKKIRCIKKQNDSNSTNIIDCSKASERKAAKTLSILVTVFLLCLVPYYINAFFGIYVRKPSVYLAFSSTLTVMYLNSSINPIIYALFYPWFQRSIKLILTLRIFSSGSSLLNVLVKEN